MLLAENQNRLSFGLFEADLKTGELWKAGRRIRLQSQPFKVLSILLEHSGAVVSREDLHKWVWETGTNVDFDRALAGAINKIRDALGDSAENPRFVETLAKRGYRFIAPVRVLESPAQQAAIATPSAELLEPVAAPLFSPLPPLSDTQSASENAFAKPGLRRRLVLSACVLGGLAVAFLLGWLFSSRGSGPDSPFRLEQVTSEGLISPGPPNAESLSSLIAAGNSVITSVLVEGEPQLASISLSSGKVRQISLPRELGSTVPVDLSRDGMKLLVLSRLSSSSEQPLWVVPTEGGSALRVSDVLAHDATWMPDGSDILYASEDKLAVVSSEGGSSTPFAVLPGRAYWLRWSPDGSTLRFTLIDPLRHTTALWEIERNNRSAHPVKMPGESRLHACCGTWTADGAGYIFQASRTNATDLWELQRGLFHNTLRQLTNGPLQFFSPVAAHTGHSVYLLGSDPPLGLQQFDPIRREFVSAPEFLKGATRVSFSRDAKWVAWTDAEARLWRARAADGSEKLQLTPAGIEVFSAAWSPDDNRLAVMARQPGEAWQISLISAAGGELKQVTDEKHNAADPTWSADGQLLVFGGEPDLMGKENNAHSLKVLNLSTGKSSVLAGSQNLFSPRWSHDGKWIAALSLDQKQVHLFNVQQQRWTVLATTSAADPVWSSDSKSLFVHAFLADEQPILQIEIPTGAVHRVADLTELRSRDSADLFFSGLTPTNEPLVLPRVGTSNLYTLNLDTHAQ